MTEFVDREEELGWLNEAWARGGPEFVVIYGRRRIGKTRLVMEFLKGKPHVYFQCLPASDDVNLSRLSEAVSRQLGLSVFRNVSFKGLDDLLTYLSEVRKGRLVIVLDEFTYWARYSPKVLGELQYFVDHVLPSTEYFLIICGSLVGVMYRSVLSYGSPLYGRRTGSIRLEQLEPWYVKHFVNIQDKTDRVRVYALVGGLPYYLMYVSGSRTLREVLKKLFGSRLSPIYEEPHMLFREEFRNPEVYYSIVSAISRGFSRLSEIADYTGLPRTHLPKYLRVLTDLGFIEYVRPVMAKRGWYEVKDPILRTWFKLVEPRLYLVEAGLYDRLIEEIRGEIDTLASKAYEEIARKYVLKKYLPRLGGGRVPIGKYVHKGTEIDLVILSKEARKAYAFEVKWSDLTEKDLEREYRKLQRKIEATMLRDYSTEAFIIARRAPKRPYSITLDDMPI